MPKITVSARFPEGTATKYIPDWGDPFISSATFNLPPDIDDVGRAAILAAIGAVEDASLPPCPSLNGNLRKLKFTRAKGNTMSVPVRTRQDLLTAATTIKGILDAGGSSDNPVVCIDLIGESYNNIADEMSLSYVPNTFAKTHRSPDTAPKQWMHSGNIQYEADSTNPVGGVIFQPVKTMTDVENSAPTQLDTEWLGCAGEFEPAVPCPRSAGRVNPLKHRRYILTLLTKSQAVNDPNNPPAGIEDNYRSERTEVPVQHHDTALIKTCGESLAALPGVFCIGYNGESYRLFHKLI